MREFVCSSCGHVIRMSHGNGQQGRTTKCPQCGGQVHRSGTGCGCGQGRGNSRGTGHSGSPGWGSNRGKGYCGGMRT